MSADRGPARSPAVGCGCSITTSSTQRLPLGGLPVIWCSGARSRPCQLILGRVARFSVLLACMDGHALRFNALVRPRDFENRTCPYCGKQFKPSRSHPHQVVCSSDDCQRRRRADYHRKRLKKDPLYSALCQDSQKIWKQTKPRLHEALPGRPARGKARSPRGSPSGSRTGTAATARKEQPCKERLGDSRNTLCSGSWLIAPKKTAADKNTFAPTHVIVIQGVTVDESGQRKARKNSALVIPPGVTYKWA